MKYPILLLSCLFLVCISGQAQWSTNPGDPLRVCSTNSSQYGPTVFSDGVGGSYVFWIDERGNANYPGDVQFFAQHLDANGVKLFPDSGKLLVNHPTLKTSGFAINRDNQGHFWVSWGVTTVTRMDSIVVQKFDKSTLNPIFSTTKTVAITNSGSFNVLYLESIKLLPTADSLLLVYQVTWMGGSSAKFVNRVSGDGKVRFGNGKLINGCSGCYGPSTAYANPDGSFLVIQRNGNGSGTGVTAWKFDTILNQNWGPKSLVSGTPGLSYAFEVVPDGNNGFIMGWVQTGGDLMATRVDSSGNFVWTPSHKPICNYSSNQDSPDLQLVNNHLYAVWIDNRPPASNSDTYMQKLDLQGNRLWNPDGRRVIRLNSYIPVPKLTADVDGNLIVTSHHNSTGFIGQKVRPDSTLEWPGYGMLIASGNTQTPFYGNYQLSTGAAGRTFVAWQGFQSPRIFIAGLATNGTFITGTSPLQAEPNPLTLIPNPSSGSIEVQGLDPETSGKVLIINAQGQELYREEVSVGQTTLTLKPELPSGIYYLKTGRQRARLVRW